MEQIITSHSERLLMITKELGLSLKKMSKELGYKNANSIYRIDRGEGEITSPLIERFSERFPEISIAFLKHGELPIVLSPEERLIQSSLLAVKQDDSNILIAAVIQKLDILHKEIIYLREDIKEIKKQ